MSDHLLQLATVVRNIAAVTPSISLEQYDDVKRIISDLEAAQSQAPQRRTITREEFERALSLLDPSRELWKRDSLHAIAVAWRLTVEDA